MYVTVISTTEARRTLAHQLDLVQSGIDIEISRYGEVVAVLTQPRSGRNSRTEAAYQAADEFGELLTAARNAPIVRARLPVGVSEDYARSIR